jgi:hypothetical protein
VEANIYLARLLDESGHTELARRRWSLVERLQPQRLEPGMFCMRDAAFRGDLAALFAESEALRKRPGGERYALFPARGSRCGGVI